MPPKLSPTPAYSSNVDLYGDIDSAGLAPRTPFSQQQDAAVEGRSRAGTVDPVNVSTTDEEDDGDADEIDLLQTQSHPLLADSTSNHVHGARILGKKGNIWLSLWERVAQKRAPIGLIAGSGIAFVLLFLVVFSVKRPDTLRDYVGVNSTAITLDALDEESQARFNDSSVIDYSQYTSFPLTTHEYIQQCLKMRKDPKMKGWVHYWEQHAEGDPDVLHKKPTSSRKTCNSSITYLLDGSVGLMADLAHLAQVAGLAREQNRSLFIYDESWNRGRWTDHFLPISETQPGPQPGCAPPPPDELVACPRTARHWVISARIAYFHFGNAFDDAFEDSYKYNIERKKPLFDRAAESFEDVILPSDVNRNLIERVRDEVRGLMSSESDGLEEEYIATHIRRGDRKAMSWRYKFLPAGQIPTSEYVDATWRTFLHFRNISTSNLSVPPVFYIATDSPSADSEFTDLVYHNESYVLWDENDPIKPRVYGLRQSRDSDLRDLAPTTEYNQSKWEERAEADRIRETRGVIVDWALVSGAWAANSDKISEARQVVRPAATICGLTTNMCKLIPVAFGWNRTFAIVGTDPGPDRRWVEIDNAGQIAPMWEPFEIFDTI